MRDSGKSSFILLILRILDPTAETAAGITIDDLPLQRIHRETLRRRIIAVPQDLVFLAEGDTFRSMLDPYGTSSEKDCRTVLEDVGLARAVDAAGGIGATASPDSLSHGQKQLFSLAVAILRARHRAETLGARESRGGILLLDEVTSSVDAETEETMQRVIGDVFRHYTVVAVTHRTNHLEKYDKVYVMADGEVVRSGAPSSIISDGNISLQ